MDILPIKMMKCAAKLAAISDRKRRERGMSEWPQSINDSNISGVCSIPYWSLSALIFAQFSVIHLETIIVVCVVITVANSLLCRYLRRSGELDDIKAEVEALSPDELKTNYWVYLIIVMTMSMGSFAFIIVIALISY